MKTIQTRSITIQNLCVPCFNRCRYCLLSWDGKAVGTEWERSIILAERFIKEIKEARPGVTVSFFYGYSMEHPNLITAIQTLRRLGSKKITLFIPHGEGRGKSLNSIRLQQQDLSVLSPDSLKLLNRDLYRTESEWLNAPEIKEAGRAIIISLRAENIENYENRDALSVVEEIEALEEEYYQAFPGFNELAREYGDRNGKSLYRFRDLYHHYRTLYASDHKLDIYDVTDERQSGSRRY